MPFNRIRRIVTGDRDGRSVVVSDEIVDPVSVTAFPGAEFSLVWGMNSAPVVAAPSPDEPAFDPYFPPAGGARLVLLSWAPESTPDAEGVCEVLLVAAEQTLPGAFDYTNRGSAMHATDTMDWCVLLSGELWLELEDGSQTRLQPGDCVVQRGTRHAWYNRGVEPAVMLVVLLGGERQPS